MRKLFSGWLHAAAALSVMLVASANAEIITNSIDDWSLDGDQGVNGWTYGYFNVTLDGDPEDENLGYGTDQFIDFTSEEDDWEWTGTGWDSTLGNVPWTFVGEANGHPNGDNNGDIHLAMRRWESDFDGTAYLTSNLAKQNSNCGNGTSVHVFHNGQMLDTITVGGGQADFSANTVEAALKPGDIIDFGLSPLGTDGTYADGCDGSFWHLEISDDAPPPPPPPPPMPVFIASSQQDWSEDGEQGANGWTNGYFNVSLDGDEFEENFGYTTDAFVDFEDEEDDWAWNGSKWDSTLGNVPWTEVSKDGGHPNGDNNGDIHFVVRRWESDHEGEVEITSGLGKTNTNCGNGTSVHLYKNGELLDTITVAGDEGEVQTSTIATTLANGDLIDFALSPLGVDETFADGCDGSAWHVDITEVGGESVAGDFNENGERDVNDIDLLTGGMAANDLAFDLNEDGTTDFGDRKMWVEELSNTFIGDSNFDGEFSSADFVAVFTTAKYETGDPATWAEGDWNGDGIFSSSDFVAAFSGGGYEQGAREGGLQVVPEPSSISLILLGVLGLCRVVRRR